MTELTDRRGVNIVESWSLKLGWLFREQKTSDQGIDAHVEKAAGQLGTGRLLAIQIKSGESYFRRRTDDGWVFRFDGKKAKLWLGHALPVLVILVDVESEVAYWQQISNRTVVSTGKGFKVEVPRSQVLSDADAVWTHIASGLESQSIGRFDYAITQLPPSVRGMLQNRPSTEHPDAALLAVHLAEGRSNPAGTTASLLATSPVWIVRQASWAWRAIASYAAEHELPKLSAEAFEKAAATASEGRGQLLAAAALNMLDCDRFRSQHLLSQAEATGQAPMAVAVVKAILEHPVGDASPRRLDPMLLSGSETVRKSHVAQSLLSDQAMRSGDFDAACHHARLALDAEPEYSAAMVSQAETLLRRSNSHQRQTDDVPTAIELLERALDQRRSWAGPSIGVLVALVRAYGLNGQYDNILERCLPSPQGTASPDEADDPQIRRSALYAAEFGGRSDLTAGLASNLGDSVEDRIARLRTGTSKLTTDQQCALWHEELDRAITDEDYEAIAASVTALAARGQDQRSRLVPYIDKSIIPGDYLELAAALLTANDDLEAALPTLRSLTRRNSIAAEILITKLASANRYVEAAQAYAALFEHTGNPYFLMARAQCLIEGNLDEAEAAAIAAVGSTSGFPADRARLFTYLGAKSVDRCDWDAAEKHLCQVVLLRANPASADVWRLVFAQVKQGKLRTAAATIAKHQPTVSHIDEARLWLNANAMTIWDETTASAALTLARRFHDPQLSTALLGHIVTRTHGVGDSPETETGTDPDIDANIEERRRAIQSLVPAELHRQAFAAIQELVSDFGDATGITMLQGNPEELVERMTGLLQETATAAAPFNDLIPAASDAKLPRGFVATARGHSYATLLVQRTLGALAAGSAIEDEHLYEVQVAGNALGQPVVVDAAALLTLTAMSVPSRMEGQFPVLQVPSAAMWDIHRAVFDICGLAGSPGTMGWDPQIGSLVFQPLGDAEFTRQLRRAQALEDFAQRLTVRAVNDLSLFAGLGDSRKHASWLEPIQLAHDQSVALWSDDLGLRRLARHLGVSSFGTPALVDTLRDQALETTSGDTLDAILQQTASDNRDLAHDLVVDVALHLEDLIKMAEHDKWQPHAASVVLSRPSWWAWQATPNQDLMNFYRHVSANNPDSLPHWQYAAMLGAGRAFQPTDAAAKLLATFALLGYGTEPTTEEAADGMRRARQVAQELGLSDPLAQLPAAASTLAKDGKCSNPEATVTAILAHFEERTGSAS